MRAETPQRQPRKGRAHIIVDEIPSPPAKLQKGKQPVRTNNDDEAEKRQRRQSLVDESRRRKSFGRPIASASAGIGPSSTTLDLDLPATQGLSPEEVNRRFEEWMKIAADNKINAGNSWNLALIDYFHDMTLLKEGDSINFTKASCTLDGCVKIYTSRVDSVDAETRKLLSGLVDSTAEMKSHRRNSDDPQEEGASGDENENGNAQVKKTRKRNYRAGRTLEADINVLNVKKFDSEFMIDPLFKKTSADFDEGDATVNQQNENYQEGATRINLIRLKSKFGTLLATIWNRDICPSLKSFEFSTENASAALPFDPSKLIPDRNPVDKTEGDVPIDNNIDDDDDDPFAAYDDTPQFEVGGDGIGDDDTVVMENDFGAGAGTGFDDDGGNDMNHQAFQGEQLQYQQQQQSEFVQGTLGEAHYVISNEPEHDGLFSCFDSQMTRGWAGPQHWRMKAIAKAKADAANATITKRKGRKIKEAVIINFINGPRPNLSELFVPGATPTTLSKSAFAATTKTKNLLPDDLHYTSKDLLQLFLKPDCTIKFRRKDGSTKIVAVEKTNGLNDTVDPFTAVGAEEEQPIGHEMVDNGQHPNAYPDDPFGFDDDDDDMDDGMIVAPTQQSDMDCVDALGSGSAEAAMRRTSMPISPMGLEDYGSQLVAQPRKHKIIPLNYARAAKRVDVRALKRNIWMELLKDPSKPRDANPFVDSDVLSQRQSVMPPSSPLPSSTGIEEVPERRRFSDVVQQLREVYPERKLRDISAAFCFICVLHLANENHLKIEGQPDLDDLVIMQG